LEKEGLLDREATLDIIQKRLPRGTLLVLVDTPVEEAVRRREEREVRLRAMRSAAIREKSTAEKKEEEGDLAQTRRLHRAIITELGKRGFSALILDGMRLPEENAMVVYKKIKELSLI
jgi:hypothetical protein